MERKIILYKNNVARLENTEPFLLPDNLSLVFDSVGYDLSTAFINLQNGELKENFKFVKRFDIPKKLLFAGKLRIGVTIYGEDKPIKKWAVLPIKIVETETGVYAFEELDVLEKKVERLIKIHEIIK